MTCSWFIIISPDVVHCSLKLLNSPMSHPVNISSTYLMKAYPLSLNILTSWMDPKCANVFCSSSSERPFTMPPQYTVQFVGEDWLYTSSNVRGFALAAILITKINYCCDIFIIGLGYSYVIHQTLEKSVREVRKRIQRARRKENQSNNMAKIVFRTDFSSFWLFTEPMPQNRTHEDLTIATMELQSLPLGIFHQLLGEASMPPEWFVYFG